MKVHVGELEQELYIRGLMKEGRDEWWVLLQKQRDGAYRANLGGGRTVASQLEFDADSEESQGRPS